MKKHLVSLALIATLTACGATIETPGTESPPLVGTVAEVACQDGRTAQGKALGTDDAAKVAAETRARQRAADCGGAVGISKVESVTHTVFDATCGSREALSCIVTPPGITG